MRAKSYVHGLYLSVITVVLLMAGVSFWQTRAEYQQMQEVFQRNERQLSLLEARLKEQQQMLDRLRNDPVYLEKVIRQQLKYAKPGEYIFRFEP